MRSDSHQPPSTKVPAYPPVAGPEPDESAPLTSLLGALQQRFGDSLQGVILYGSCLRSGDLLDGVVDLYALVDSYRRAYPSLGLRLSNRLLPPNVYYLERPLDDGPSPVKVRCKYAVLSLAQFERGMSERCFESYLWGRFAQPVKLVYSRSPAQRARIEQSLLRAAETLLRRALPALSQEGSVEHLWRDALALSYSTELRTERQGRAQELSRHSRDFFQALTLELASRLEDCLHLETGEPGSSDCYYRARIPAWKRRLAPWLWRLRRLEGKLMSVLRLLKGLFTFEGGLDYIAWKLERHSGQRVEIPDKVRRRPLLHIWGLFWRLYRRGVFR